jgi:hypothetical protein
MTEARWTPLKPSAPPNFPGGEHDQRHALESGVARRLLPTSSTSWHGTHSGLLMNILMASW